MAKKKVKNKKPSQRWKMYKISGDTIERSRFCPKCGSGVFMARHKDRYFCGSCHYSEILKK